MLKVTIAAAAAAIMIGSVNAQAEVLTQFNLIWQEGLTSEMGGKAWVEYDSDGDLMEDSRFAVNVAAFGDSLRIPNRNTLNWLTSVEGEGATFAPVKLYSIWGTYKGTFSTNMGMGFKDPDLENGLGRGLKFPENYAKWSVELDPAIDHRIIPVSSVPEPSSTSLLVAGLAMMLRIAKRRARSEKNVF